jgi:hypothetical protein
MNKIYNILSRPFVPQLVLIIILAFLIWYFILRKKTSEAESSLNDDISEPALSYPQSQYYILADQIQQATQANNDDEALIYNVFRQMKTRSDVLNLIRVFGNRSYWLGLTSGYALNASLVEVLHQELNSSEIGTINQILSTNNINLTI